MSEAAAAAQTARKATAATPRAGKRPTPVTNGSDTTAPDPEVADTSEGPSPEAAVAQAESAKAPAPAKAPGRGNGRSPAASIAEQRREARAVQSNRKRAQEQALAYVPLKSHPAPQMKLELCSEHSLALFQKNYGFAHVAFYELVTLLPKKVKMADPDFDTDTLIETIETILINHLDTLSRSLELRKRQLTEVMKANGGYAPFAANDYSSATSVSLPMLTPHTRRMLGVLKQFDEIVRHVDRIWIETHMSDLEHDRAISHCRDEIVRAIRFFKRLHVQGGHLVRNMGTGKAVDVGRMFSAAGDDSQPDPVDPELEAQAREVSETALQRATAPA